MGKGVLGRNTGNFDGVASGLVAGAFIGLVR